jgi:tRNA nucleotidyltransferase (CCA-adding enzyme)
MEKHLKKLPEEILSLIYISRDIAEELGFNVYLIGGFVRDLILGVKNFDLDIAVEGDGIKFADSLAGRLKARLIRHRRFGTATVNVKPHLKVDIATTRKEFYPEPACLPVVNNGMLKDDLTRRDFTINTLAVSISGKSFGKLIDLFDGKNDINNKKIRILHNLSFIDDPTRILRAIRFEQRYNFKIEPNTLKCLKEAVKLKMLTIVQPQRLRDEIILILKEDRPLKQIRRIGELVGFDFINSVLSVSRKTYELFSSISSEINWFRAKFVLHRQLDGWLIYFMALIDSLNTVQAQSLCRRFVFRKGEEKRILTYKKVHSSIMLKLSINRIKPSTVFHLLEPLSYEVILLLKAKSQNKNIKKHIEDFFHIYHGTDISVSGHDLKGLGFTPGPHYQKIFHRLLNAKLNGEVQTRKEELEFAKKLKNPK